MCPATRSVFLCSGPSAQLISSSLPSICLSRSLSCISTYARASFAPCPPFSFSLFFSFGSHSLCPFISPLLLSLPLLLVLSFPLCVLPQLKLQDTRRRPPGLLQGHVGCEYVNVTPGFVAKVISDYSHAKAHRRKAAHLH